MAKGCYFCYVEKNQDVVGATKMIDGAPTLATSIYTREAATQRKESVLQRKWSFGRIHATERKLPACPITDIMLSIVKPAKYVRPALS